MESSAYIGAAENPALRLDHLVLHVPKAATTKVDMDEVVPVGSKGGCCRKRQRASKNCAARGLLHTRPDSEARARRGEQGAEREEVWGHAANELSAMCSTDRNRPTKQLSGKFRRASSIEISPLGISVCVGCTVIVGH